MKGEINIALDRLEERKAAAAALPDRLSTPEQTRLVWSGLDLDYEEISGLMPEVFASVLQAVVGGVPVHQVGAGMWFDGIAIGLLIAEQRHQEVRA